MPRNTTSIESVLARVVKQEDGCWIWPGGRTRPENGYGLVTVKGRNWLVHRFVYSQLRGEIPAGKQIDHLCRNRMCCNPDHLDLVTAKQNRDRGDLAVERTHCPQGHEYTIENTVVNARGVRECKACRNAAARRRYNRTKPPSAERTHCPQGHEYTPENTGIVTKSGERYCKECRRVRARDQYYKNLEANRAKARERQRQSRGL